jgi:glyoxylate reductase
MAATGPDARPRLFVARALQDAPLAAALELGAVDVWEQQRPPSRQELIERAADADVILTTISERLDASVIRSLPFLRGVANLAVGYDNIDVNACHQRGITVTNTPGVLSQAVAEMTIALIYSTCRRIAEGAAAVKAGQWGEWDPNWMCGREVRGATLGIVGLGRIGTRVAELAQAVGMNVLSHSRSGQLSLADVLGQADIISVHVPLTQATHHYISRDELSMTKRGAILINTSRGGVVDEAAVIEALRSGHLSGVALDVTEEEPMPRDHPLLTFPNVIVTPHIGSATNETRRAMIDLAVANACDLMAGERPRHVVEPSGI